MNEADIFAQALKLNDSAERDEYLKQACEGDESQRRRLERLLEAHFDPQSMFEAPGEPTASGNLAAIELPERDDETAAWERASQKLEQIGPYKLLQKIGEGGMGVVYMAEQLEPVKRRVAVKVVKPGMDSKRVLARFEAERQALALMDHPNIAKVLDAGATKQGLPYFVMELVHGLPMTEYCDQQKLGPAARLELFIQVCQGIQHAHQKGIIHRDLKPSNILVAEYDERPVPKIIDFGVAKAVGTQLTDKTLFTEFGQIIGTLEYMSPEQAKRNQLDIDTRSDVYSLGIVLYSLLTGETPFSGPRLKEAAWDEILRVIREEEPKLPSLKLTDSQKLEEVALNRRMEPARLTAIVKGDLDWIVMKALQKERSRRYESASELASDIHRHLTQQPVSARPPSWSYRAQKFVARNRTGVFVAVVLCLLAAVSIGFAQASYRSTLRDKQRATIELNRVMQAASLALGKAVNTPAGQTARWEAVDAHTSQINSSLESGLVSPEERQNAQKLLSEIETAKQDREIGDLIEEVLLAGATQMNLESWQAMERRIRSLFSKNDMDLDALDPMEVAKRIRASQFPDRWTDALELWLGTRGQMQSFPGGQQLTAADMQPWANAMYAADDNPLRTAVRRQIYERTMDGKAVDRAVQKADLGEQGPRALSWLAVVYLGCGEPEKAEEIFDLALKQYPQDVMLNYDFALSLQEQDRNQEAIRMFNRCIALRPDVRGFWLSMAELLEGEDELDAATKARARAAELVEAQESK